MSTYETGLHIVATVLHKPANRCIILELHWNGAKLVNLKTMLAWARSMAPQHLYKSQLL
jgi:hypothetical protein